MKWLPSKEIAKAMQVTPNRVEKWKNKQSVPSLAERHMLADLHSCAPHEFIDTKLVKMHKAGDLWRASVYNYKVSLAKGMGSIDGQVFEGKHYHRDMENFLTAACGQRIFLGVGL